MIVTPNTQRGTRQGPSRHGAGPGVPGTRRSAAGTAFSAAMLFAAACVQICPGAGIVYAAAVRPGKRWHPWSLRAGCPVRC
jgi:hypothetical protein